MERLDSISIRTRTFKKFNDYGVFCYETFGFV